MFFPCFDVAIVLEKTFSSAIKIPPAIYTITFQYHNMAHDKSATSWDIITYPPPKELQKQAVLITLQSLIAMTLVVQKYLHQETWESTPYDIIAAESCSH